MLRAARFSAILVLGLSALAPAAPARADKAPVIVIPSRPGIPVVINGRDASYAIVEGDWGLARPGHMPVTIIGGSPLQPNRVYHRRNSYHPRYGRAPERGRNEVEPPPDRPMPEPPESYSRSWSTRSGSQPVSHVPAVGEAAPSDNAYNSGADPMPPTITDPQTFPRNFDPPVIEGDRRRRR